MSENNNISILYMEDNQESREVMAMTLEYRLGISDYWIYEESSNFVQKLNSLEKTPDIIFLDIHMSPHTGFEMLNMIREHADYGDNVKVIALTASVMNEEISALRQARFNGAIAKPIDPDSFPQLVNRILRGDNIWFIT